MAGLPPPPIDTYQALVTTFSDFLTVAIHTILYERNIYPRESFLSARKYNYPVRQNRHPKVCKWITDAVAAVETEILKGTVSRIAVVIYSPQCDPLERFMFDISTFPTIPPGEALTLFERASDDQISEEQSAPSVPEIDLDEQFRAVMSRLAVCGSTLGPIPEDCSFTVCIELKEKSEPPIGHPQPWIPAQPSLQPVGEDETTNTEEGPKHGRYAKGSDIGGVRTLPVRAIEAGDFALEMWIEEGRAKGRSDQGEEAGKEVYDDPP
ncbi:MAG: hypothetical protein M1835_003947 [Candelina submexicana]|nr:MAG: hypothetical protein M1835_003947 [Candelina submexicana]